MHHYKHSGTVTLHGLIGTAVAAVPTAVVLAVVYTYAIAYIPYVYLNLAATAGFGCAMGWVVGWGATVGKIRNTPVVGLLGVGAGLIGLYVAWAVDPLARFGPAEGFLAFDPQVLAAYIQLFYEQGAWSLGAGDNPVTGPFLAIVWLAEAAIILGSAAALALRAIEHRPFCEPCNQWTATQTDVRRFLLHDAPDRRAALLDRLGLGDFAALSELHLAAGHEPEYLRLDLARCATCSESTFLTLVHCTPSKAADNKSAGGKPATETNPVLTNLPTNEEELGVILHLCDHLESAPTDAASPAAAPQHDPQPVGE